MPNWCSNRLEIRGKNLKEIKDKFQSKNNKDQEISFMEIIPLNEEKEWGYDLAIEKWGTKWEPQTTSVDYDEDFLDYQFLTAWSPPTKIFDKLIELFPENAFKLSFEEPGCDFSGKYYYDPKNLVRKYEGSYEEYSEDSFEYWEE